MYFIPVIIIVGILAWVSRPGKDLPKTGKNAILLLSIPSLILAAASVIVQLVQNSTGNTDLSDISNILFIIGVAIIIIAIVFLAFYAIKHKAEIVRALSFAVCISVITCVAELFVLGLLAGDF